MYCSRRTSIAILIGVTLVPAIFAGNEPEVRPNLMTAGYTATPPKVDGGIAPDEYPSHATGLVDTGAQTLYPFKNEFGFAHDGAQLYLGFSLQLPPGYQLKNRGSVRDDPALIAAKDVFYLFIRPDNEVSKKGYPGAYLAVSANGVVYDAWEQIDWKGAGCQRDEKGFNANWKIATKQVGDVWTIELSVPIKDLRLPTDFEKNPILVSFGMNLETARLAWQSHPSWFDHYQAFGQLLLSRDGLRFDVPSFGQLNRGITAPGFRLANTSRQELKYHVLYVVSTPKMIAGRIGGYVFDVALDVSQQQFIRDKAVWFWEQAGSLKAGESKEEKASANLTAPKFYVLEVEAKAGDKACFYQKMPFNYSPPIVASLRPVPSKDIVKATVSLLGAREEERGKLKIAFQDAGNRPLVTQEVEVKEDVVCVPVSMTALKPGDYQVQFTLTGKNGQAVASEAQSFKKWETPEWLSKRKGIEALQPDWVPAPWTPMTVKGNQVSLWGRSCEFQAGSLMAKMISQNVPLLAAPITLRYQADGKEQSFSISKPEFPLKARGRVEVAQKGESPLFSLTAKQRVEFDGMDRFDLRIAPKRPANVDKLWMEIPLAESKYLAYSTTDNTWQAGLLPAEGLTRPVCPIVLWLGNDRVGCSFFTENYKGWVVNSQKPRVQVVKRDQAAVLQLLLVNEPSEVDAPIEITFGLHTTPVKPFFAGWRGLRYTGLGITRPPNSAALVSPDYWNDSYSKPLPRNWPAMRDMVKYAHALKQKVYPYIGLFYLSPYHYIKSDFPFSSFENNTGFPPEALFSKKKDATRLEEYFYYQADWDLVPPHINTPEWETREEVRVTPSGSWSDFFAHGVHEMLTKSDVDGFFLDIDNPMLNLDPEKALVYKTKDGKEEGTFELLATRDLYKRLYCIFDAIRGSGRKPYLIGHGFAFTAPYMSFWDAALNGEEIKAGQPFDVTRLFKQKTLAGKPCGTVDPSIPTSYDLYPFRCIYGGQFGIVSVFLPQYGYDPKLMIPEHSREILAFTTLHNTLLQTAYIPAEPVVEFRRKVEAVFGMEDVSFYPYWENQAQAEPESIRVSWYRKNGQEDYLVAIGNFGDQAETAKITLPAPLSSFAECLDMEKEQVVPVKAVWEIAIPAHDLRMFRFAKPSAK